MAAALCPLKSYASLKAFCLPAPLVSLLYQWDYKRLFEATKMHCSVVKLSKED